MLRCSLRSVAWQERAFKFQRHRSQSSRFGRLGRHRDPRYVVQLGELAAWGITAGYREGFGVTFVSEHGDIQGEPSPAGIVPASNSERDRLKALLRCRGQMLMGRFDGRTILTKFNPEKLMSLLKRVVTLFMKDDYCGMDPSYSIQYRFVGEDATHAYFVECQAWRMRARSGGSR